MRLVKPILTLVFLMFLTSFSVVGAQSSMGMSTSPQQPIAGQPITFNVKTGTGDFSFYFGIWREARVNGNLESCSAVNPQETTPLYLTIQEAKGGYFQVTLTRGLPAGSYAVGVAPIVGTVPSSECWDVYVAAA